MGLEAKSKMRSFLVAVAGLMLFATGAAQAKVEITVDKNAQLMTVAVDGVERYQWPVSTGNPSHETPNGTFRTFRMEADHFSKEFDDAPMPHSIFFTKIGHAIHGTFDERHIGTPASHGCVRLSRDHAATLYALVEKEGVLNTTVTLTGSAQIALAHGVQPRDVASTRGPLSIAPQARGYGNDDDGYANQNDYRTVPSGGPRGSFVTRYSREYDEPPPVPPARVGSVYSPNGYGVYPPQPYPAQGYSTQGYPNQGYPNQGYPPRYSATPGGY